jgi:hypothetical protein
MIGNPNMEDFVVMVLAGIMDVCNKVWKHGICVVV